MMFAGGALVVVGFALQVIAWCAYRRDFPKFWVSRPIWYFLYPKGVGLFVAGVWVALAGIALCAKA